MEWMKRYIEECNALLENGNPEEIRLFIYRVSELAPRNFDTSYCNREFKDSDESGKLVLMRNDLKTVRDWLMRQVERETENVEKAQAEEEAKREREHARLAKEKAEAEARLAKEKAEAEAKLEKEKTELARKYGTTALDQHIDRCRRILRKEEGSESAEEFCKHVACVYLERIPGLRESLSVFSDNDGKQYEEDVAKLLEFFLVYRDDLTKDTTLPTREIDRKALLLSLL